MSNFWTLEDTEEHQVRLFIQKVRSGTGHCRKGVLQDAATTTTPMTTVWSHSTAAEESWGKTQAGAVNSTACLQKIHFKNTRMQVIATCGLEGAVCTQSQPHSTELEFFSLVLRGETGVGGGCWMKGLSAASPSPGSPPKHQEQAGGSSTGRAAQQRGAAKNVWLLWGGEIGFIE